MKKHLYDINKTLNSHNFLREILFLILLLIITSFIYSFLFKVYPLRVMGDAFRFNGYQMYVIKYSFANFGQFALWDQFLSAGMSWVSHPGGTLFFPSAWLISLLIDNFALGTVTLFFFHLLTAVVSFYFLLRVVGLQKITSFFVSISYITTQYVFVFLMNGWFEELLGFTLLPLTAGLLILATLKNNYLYAILAAIAMSLNFLGNSYYVFHYNAIVLLWIAFVFGVNKLIIKKQNVKINLKDIKSFMLINGFFWITFVGLSAVKLLPLLEFRGLSSRNYMPLAEIESSDSVMTFSFLFNQLRNFLYPVESFTGTLRNLFQIGNYFAFLLIILCVLYAVIKKNRIYWLFISLLLIGVWGYLANRLPIDFYALMYNILPGFNSNKLPYRFIIIINLAFFVCFALGLDIFIRQKKKLFVFLGYFIGLVLVINGFLFTSVSYNSNKLPREFFIANELKKPMTFEIEKKMDGSPEITGKINTNLLTVLSKIIKKYEPEGRIHSTFVSGDNAMLVDNLLLGELPSIQSIYDLIVPTYQFGIVKNLKTEQDSLDLFKKQFKIYTVLNVRFQLQQKEYSEFKGCEKLNHFDKDNINVKLLDQKVCEFLENRIEKVLSNEKGGIYYDKDVLSKVSLLPRSVLVINDNRFNDYSGFISKKIMFHSDFDEKKVSLFSGGSSFLDYYTLDELKEFSAVLLVDPKVKSKDNTDKLINDYKKSGGIILKISSKYIPYESLHKRSLSLWTEKSAWSYSKEDDKRLSDLFKKLNITDSDIGNLKITKFTPEDLVFEVSTKEDNLVLQYSDSYYPGWKATIDNKPVNVYMADGLVKGVLIEKKGNHIIRFYYASDSLKKGAIITMLTITSLLGIMIYKYSKNIRRMRRKKVKENHL